MLSIILNPRASSLGLYRNLPLSSQYLDCSCSNSHNRSLIRVFSQILCDLHSVSRIFFYICAINLTRHRPSIKITTIRERPQHLVKSHKNPRVFFSRNTSITINRNRLFSLYKLTKP